MAAPKRVDGNQADLIRDIRKMGGEVSSIAMVGGGVSDLLVSYRGKWFVFEVKDPEQPKSKQKLTTHETKWIARQKAPVYIVRDMTDVINAFYKEGKKDERDRGKTEPADY